jgi:hypothetical protein
MSTGSPLRAVITVTVSIVLAGLAFTALLRAID